MSVKEMLGKQIPIAELPLKAGITYYELVQLWIFEKFNHFKEAKDRFLVAGEKIDFAEANKTRTFKDEK